MWNPYFFPTMIPESCRKHSLNFNMKALWQLPSLNSKKKKKNLVTFFPSRFPFMLVARKKTGEKKKSNLSLEYFAPWSNPWHWPWQYICPDTASLPASYTSKWSSARGIWTWTKAGRYDVAARGETISWLKIKINQVRVRMSLFHTQTHEAIWMAIHTLQGFIRRRPRWESFVRLFLKVMAF